MKVSEFVEREIVDMIHKEMEAGEKLPSETELASRYGVSRASVREAIQSLESKNVIIRRNGRSYVVSSPEDVFVAPLKVMINLNFAMPDELSQVRILLETEAFRLAFDRIDDDELRRLEDIVWMMQKPMIKAEKFFALDNEFHSIIAEASGNTVLCTFIKDITKVMSSLYVEEEGQKQGDEANIDQIMRHHKDILEGFLKGDKEMVLAAAQRHLHECTGKIFER